MGQERDHEVVRDATLTFAHILKTKVAPKLDGKKGVEVVFDFPDEKLIEKCEKDHKVLISVFLIDTVRDLTTQVMEEPVVREEDDDGNIVEYRQGIPTTVRPRYLFTPWSKDPLEAQTVQGVIMRYFFDFPNFQPEDVQGDVIHGESRAPITFDEKFRADDQMKLWQSIGRPFRSGLVYSVGLVMHSMKKTVLRRVKERVLDYKKLQG